MKWGPAVPTENFINSAVLPLLGDTMNFDNTTPHYTAREHRPSYYYLYHRARAYGTQAPNASYPPISNRYAPPALSREQATPSIDRGPQTVEDLVSDGYFAAQAPHASYPPISNRYAPPALSREQAPADIDRGPQTVEDLVRDGYFAVSKREPETAVLVDRQDMAWLTLDDALTQIREREDIYRKNMLEIEWAKCYAFGELARLGWPASDETSTLYQRRIADLHADQRAERVRFWNDLSRVRQLVPPSAQLYLSAIRKSEILGLDEGDSL